MAAPRRTLLAIILVTMGLVILLTACRNGETAFVLEEQVRIMCTEECAARGQCGTLPDGRQAILADDRGPAVSQHNRFFVHETLATIVNINERELIAAVDGVPQIAQTTPFPHLFYQVSAEGKTAWVSQWCIERP